MNDTIKVYTPEEISDTPFPQEAEDSQVITNPSSSGVTSPSQTKDSPFPSPARAKELINEAINTKSKTIMKEFTFQQSGGLRIGTYKQGENGEIIISPIGILAKNSNGEYTIAIDGETGDAIFKGQIQTGSLITGQVVVGDGRVVIDGTDEGKITIKDDTDTTIIDAKGLVSTANFQNGSVTDSNAFTTAAGSFVDVTNMSLAFTLTRAANVLFGASVVGRNDSVSSSNPYTAITQLVIDGTQYGGYMVTPGLPTSGGIANMTGATSIIVPVAAGSHTVKLQLSNAGSGTARLVASNPKTLWYVVLGK